MAEEVNFRIQRANYFNSVGAVGWWINKLLENKPGNKGLVWQTLLFDRLIVPAVGWFEKSIKLPFGQSVMLIGEK